MLAAAQGSLRGGTWEAGARDLPRRWGGSSCSYPQPCPPGSRARARGSRWPARLATIALLMVLLHPCSSALEKGAVVFPFSEKGSIASWGEGGNTMLSAGPFPLRSFVS